MALSWQNLTQANWDASINARTFSVDYYEGILKGLYPFSSFELGNIAGLTGSALYDEITPYQLVSNVKVYDTKLPYSPNVTDEIPIYKLYEIARIGLAFRALSLHNWKLSAVNAATLDTYSNLILFIEKIVDDNMATEMALIEVEDALLKSEFDFQVDVDEVELRMALGNRVIATINKMNRDNNITTAQVTAILSSIDVQNILTLLEVGSLENAKGLTQLISLTGLEPMDAGYKTRIIGIIDNYLGV